MKQTGVSATLHASHDDPRGDLPRHWHSREIIAWFSHLGDARDRRVELDESLATLQGMHLDPSIAWGEDLAEHLAKQLPGCVEIEIRRPGERLLARWRADC